MAGETGNVYAYGIEGTARIGVAVDYPVPPMNVVKTQMSVLDYNITRVGNHLEVVVRASFQASAAAAVYDPDHKAVTVYADGWFGFQTHAASAVIYLSQGDDGKWSAVASVHDTAPLYDSPKPVPVECHVNWPAAANPT